MPLSHFRYVSGPPTKKHTTFAIQGTKRHKSVIK